MSAAYPILLEFDPARNRLGKGKALTDGLSAVVRIGDSLWVGNDESLGLERLTLAGEGATGSYSHARRHTWFPLGDYLQLPLPADPDEPEEADVEGLAYADGYLWLVGSHSLKRKQPDRKDDAGKAFRQLAKVSRDGNRYLLARIPVVQREGSHTLAKTAALDGKPRTAARLRGNDEGNELTEALRGDAHLGPFLGIPGKDNGFDIEGLAVAGGRLFVGLRGPVLRGWAVILEVEAEAAAAEPSDLRLKAIGPDRRPYRKHFLDLGGLGIRELCVHGADLLILAGPTMDLDGPVAVFRWRGGAAPAGESLVPAGELEHVLDVPYGRGDDHAEGMTLFAPEGGEAGALLVVYDAASRARRSGENAVAADVFTLPA